MRFLAYLSCVASLAAASPVVSQEGGSPSAFTLSQVPNQKFGTQENGLDARVWAYVKYGVALPPGLKNALRFDNPVNSRYKAQSGNSENGSFVEDDPITGTVRAFPPREIDIQYVVPVQIGTPEQTVFLNLDTGSADLWTFSSDTPARQVGEHALYNANASSTAKLQDGQRWRIRYGDGSGASGIVYKDRVAIGATTFANQSVEAATFVSGAFTRDEFSSGLLGLGFGRANTIRPDNSPTYMENIMPGLARPLFTANLQAGRPGNYNFGYIAEREYRGPIAYTPVTAENPYWEVTIGAYQIGTGPVNRTDLLERVVVDTGTTLMLLPDPIIEEYYDQVDGSRFDESLDGWVFPCNSTLPDWYFVIGQYKGLVPGQYINYNSVDEEDCFGGIQSSEDIGFSLFGAILLKAQFVVFDYVEPRVGAATPRVGFANKPLAI